MLALIHTPRRSRLSSKRLHKSLFIKFNRRLLNFSKEPAKLDQQDIEDSWADWIGLTAGKELDNAEARRVLNRITPDFEDEAWAELIENPDSVEAATRDDVARVGELMGV